MIKKKQSLEQIITDTLGAACVFGGGIIAVFGFLWVLYWPAWAAVLFVSIVFIIQFIVSLIAGQMTATSIWVFALIFPLGFIFLGLLSLTNPNCGIFCFAMLCTSVPLFGVGIVGAKTGQMVRMKRYRLLEENAMEKKVKAHAEIKENEKTLNVEEIENHMALKDPKGDTAQMKGIED